MGLSDADTEIGLLYWPTILIEILKQEAGIKRIRGKLNELGLQRRVTQSGGSWDCQDTLPKAGAG
jgi:hypothetical protein